MRLPLRVFVAAVFAVLALSIFPDVLTAKAEDVKQVITLAPPPATAGTADAAVQTGSKPKAVSSRLITRPDGVQEVYREFGSAKVGQDAAPEYFLLQFHAATKVTAITASGDFHVVSGGTCIEGYTYAAGQSCDVKMVFTPTGPGHRTGQLSVAHSDSATPFLTPAGGQAYGPAVSFVPSQIETVPGTLAGSGLTAAGTLQQPQELAVDGGDNLYIADTGNGLVKSIDSTGTVRIIHTINTPTGVAADPYGHIFIADNSDIVVLEQYANGYSFPVLGVFGSAGSVDLFCSYASPCGAFTVTVGAPFGLAADPYGNMFLSEYDTNYDGYPAYYPGAVTPNAATIEHYVAFTPLFDGVGISTSPRLAVDSSDDLLYPAGPATGTCQILGQNQEESDYNTGESWVVAGSGPCGFSGDGGRAGSAEIGQSIGQIAFDLAGNVYFTDSSNNRVRRIDAVSGVIRTIAGNGTGGYGGDGGASTSANLQAPGGVAVDSTGKVYATAVGGSNALYSDIRAFGTIGLLNFGSLAVGTSSTTQTVLLSNVGNDTLNFFHIAVGSGNTTDFTIDPNTTTCIVGVPLPSGHNCNIGLIFTPTTTGSRSASVLVADDTVNGLNTIQVSGAGTTTATLTPASLTFASTTVGYSSAAQTATLTNTGKAAMTISSIAFSGTNATSFTNTTTCGLTLAAAASCTISVTFKPVSAGTLTATLTVIDNATGGKQTVTLSGTAVAAAAKASLSPTSLAFGSETVAVASAAKALTLSNTGGAAMTISSYAFSGTNSADFTETTTCVSPLAAGASCTINVVFKPAAAGARTATLTVNTSGGNVAATLTGTGVAATTTPRVALTSMANPTPANSTLMLTAVVTGSSSAKPTGSVELMEGTKVWAEGALSAGTVTFKLAGMTAGVHLLDAVYLGDAKNPAMTSAILRQVVGAGTVSNPTAPPVAPVSR